MKIETQVLDIISKSKRPIQIVDIARTVLSSRGVYPYEIRVEEALEEVVPALIRLRELRMVDIDGRYVDATRLN